ncbi:MAG: efflux RND transporter periplasmic adaptor subunit [Mariprofundaceae bacterium]|nr:efflux RND transporter periplasmic adaptor subunit [Mariprofundaceae bacterium]
MTKRMIMMLLMMAAVIGGVIWFQMFKAKKMAEFLAGNAAPPAMVTAMEAPESDWQPQWHAVGSLRAKQSVNISSEVAGLVAKVGFTSGQVIKRGDVLLTLDSNTAQAQLQALKAAEVLAASTLQRDLQQYRVHAVSRAKLDADEADLAVKKAQVKEQRERIAQTRITAPFDGVVGIRHIDEGQYIRPGDVVTSLTNHSQLFVDFSLPQQVLAELESGQPVRVRVNAFPEEDFAGHITALNPNVDAASRNIQVEAQMDNPQGQLLPGMFVQVAINHGTLQHAITLPQTALSFQAYGATIFLAKAEQKDGKELWKAEQVFVKTGAKRGDQVAILEGVKAGDKVVTSGQMKLRNGTVLVIDNRVEPSNDATPMPQDR